MIILEMDSHVSSATHNSDALSYFPVEIDDQCTFDDESSSRGAECRGARLRAMVGQDLGKLAHLNHMRYCLWCFYDLCAFGWDDFLRQGFRVACMCLVCISLYLFPSFWFQETQSQQAVQLACARPRWVTCTVLARAFIK